MTQPPIERPWDAPPPPVKPGMSNAKVFWIIMGGLAAVFALLAISSALTGGTSPGKSSPVDANGDKYSAFVVCQDGVSAQLKAPSTAEFASISDSSVTGGSNGVWNVSSYVDAQNGFGAMIRTNWICTATHTSGSYYQTSVTLLN